MSPPVHPTAPLAEPRLALPPAAAATPAQAAKPASFAWAFWFTYASNMALSVAASMLYRYADLVKLLDGTELQLGLIVGIGMVGSLLMRAGQGIGIDAYGPKGIWLASSALFAIACLGHLFVSTVDSPLIFALRILFQVSIAGFFGGSITFISGRAPVARMAEVIGNLGTSGFIGMALGSFTSDELLGKIPTRGQVNSMFLVASAMGVAAFVFSWLATQGAEPASARRRRRPRLRTVRRYAPAPILLVAAAVGFGLGLPTIFLRPFLADLKITEIALFFSVYPAIGFIARLSIRRLPERLGIRPMIAWGMAALVGSMLLFLPVTEKWHLVFPAVLLGIAHAMLFPPVVAGGSAAFPIRYRGLGTTLVLAMFDLGTLIGSPTVGGILDASGRLGLPRYETMFTVIAAILAAIGLVYFVASRPRAKQHRVAGFPAAIDS